MRKLCQGVKLELSEGLRLDRKSRSDLIPVWPLRAELLVDLTAGFGARVSRCEVSAPVRCGHWDASSTWSTGR